MQEMQKQVVLFVKLKECNSLNNEQVFAMWLALELVSQSQKPNKCIKAQLKLQMFN
jgi:hypothetical protein